MPRCDGARRVAPRNQDGERLAVSADGEMGAGENDCGGAAALMGVDCVCRPEISTAGASAETMALPAAGTSAETKVEVDVEVGHRPLIGGSAARWCHLAKRGILGSPLRPRRTVLCAVMDA